MDKKINRLLCYALIAGCCVIRASAQTTQIKGFMNVNAYAVSDTSKTNMSKTFFRLGQYDFFVTSQVTDKISFLGESVFEFDGDFGVDVERLFVKYQHNDHFAVSAGKFHSPIGYWNNAFHHGLVIQPIIVRPDAIRFEDDGGILPVHETGVQLDAEHYTNLDIGLNVLISNGLGSTPVDDRNYAKAITANLHAEPVENLVLTVSGYFNQAPANFTNPQDVYVYNPVKTTILNGSIAYMNSSHPYEFIGEYYSINQDEDSVGLHNKMTNVVVVYAGYKIKKFTIYGCFEQDKYPDGIEYYVKNNTTSIIGGIRYKASPLAVVKLQYRNYKTEAPTIADEMRTGIQNIIEAQFAVGF